MSEPTFGKSRWRNVVLIPEPVSLLQDLELLTKETAEGRTHHGATERSLGQTSNHEVDVVLVVVDGPEQADDLVVHGVVELVEAVDGREAAVLPDLGVGGQAVVSTCLNDGRDLVNSEICNHKTEIRSRGGGQGRAGRGLSHFSRRQREMLGVNVRLAAGWHHAAVRWKYYSRVTFYMANIKY